MKALKKFFRSISLIFLYLGFSGLAGVFGILLYGITSDFVSTHMDSRGLASVQSKSSKITRTPPKKVSRAPTPKKPIPPQPLKTAKVINEQPPPSKTLPSNNSKSPQTITASEVKDKKSLKSFVLKAKEHLEKDYDRALKDFRSNKIWKASFTYLTVLDMSGTFLFNASRPDMEGQNKLKWKSKNDKKITMDMINVGKKGGGFYEYRKLHPDTDTLHPRLLYIANFRKGKESFMIISGFFPKTSSINPNPPQPPKTAEMINEQTSPPRAPSSNHPKSPQTITASEIKDKNSLKSFTLRAKEYLEKDYDGALKDFKTDKIWKTPTTNLIVMDLSGTILFSASRPHLNGRNLINWENIDGETIFKDIIAIGKNGSGFYKIRSHHPDTNILQPKLLYINTFKKGEKTFIVFASFFLKDSSNNLNHQTIKTSEVINERSSPYKASTPSKPNSPQSITASEVKDKESLKSFVLRAKKYWEKDYNTALKEFRTNKIWGTPSVHLLLLDLKGNLIFHSFDPSSAGKNGMEWKTKDGTTYIKDIINIGKSRDDFYRYSIYIPNRKTYRHHLHYITSFKKGKKTFILSGVFMTGFLHQKNPQTIKTTKVISEQTPPPKAPSSNNPNPPQSITASKVKDKKSLKSFVLKAKEHLEKDYDSALKDFRSNQIWKTPLTYLSVLDLSGTILFSAPRPDMEGQNGMEWKNKDGSKTIAGIVNIGKNGGGFYEARAPHPHTKILHSKSYYIIIFKNGEESLILVSGFFPKNSSLPMSEKI